MLKRIGTYFGIEVVNKLSAVLVLPIITGLLSVSDFGIYSLFMPITLGIVILSSLGLAPTYSRYLFDPEIDNNSLISTFGIITFISVFIISIFSTVFLCLFRSKISLVVAASLILFSVITGLIGYAKSYFVVHEKSKEYVKYLIIQTLVWITCIVLLKTLNVSKLNAIIGVLVFSNVVGFIVAYRDLKGFVSFSLRLDMGIVKNTNAYRKQMFSSSVFSYVYQNADRFVVASLLSFESLGIYSLALAVSSIVRSSGSAVENAFMPKVFNLLDIRDFEKIRLTFRKIEIFGVLLVAIFVLALKFLWEYFFSSEYSLASVLSAYLAFAFYFETITLLKTNFFTFYKRPELLLRLEIAFGIVQLLSYILVLSYFGLSKLVMMIFVLSILKLLMFNYVISRNLFINVFYRSEFIAIGFALVFIFTNMLF